LVDSNRDGSCYPTLLRRPAPENDDSRGASTERGGRGGYLRNTGARPACASTRGDRSKRGWWPSAKDRKPKRQNPTPTPPNALIDHWPAAC